MENQPFPSKQAEAPMTKTDETRPLAVTQEDRDAAAKLARQVHGKHNADLIRAGEADGHYFVQAFARFERDHMRQPAATDAAVNGVVVAAKYAEMGTDQKANAMADDGVGDPWELLGYFREKLRQSQGEADHARSSTGGFRCRIM